MDKITHKVRCEQWTAIINECLASGMIKTAWCKANGISDKQFFYWQRILRQEAYQQMESQSSSPASFALVPNVKEEKASHPAFVEIRPVTSDIEPSAFRQNVIIRSGNLTVEIANTASEELGGLFMFNDATGFKKIFLKVGYTDIRKGIPRSYCNDTGIF